MMRPVHQINHSTRIGWITAPASESGTVQRLQIKYNHLETSDAVASVQHFGLQSSPPVHSIALVQNLGGDNGNGIVVATANANFRVNTLVPGETRLHDDKGQSIYISQSNGKLSISITAGQEVDITCSTKVAITAPTVAITGNLTVSGTIVALGDVTAGAVHLETHHHTNVQGGTGNSGGPVG